MEESWPLYKRGGRQPEPSMPDVRRGASFLSWRRDTGRRLQVLGPGGGVATPCPRRPLPWPECPRFGLIRAEASGLCLGVSSPCPGNRLHVGHAVSKLLWPWSAVCGLLSRCGSPLSMEPCRGTQSVFPGRSQGLMLEGCARGPGTHHRGRSDGDRTPMVGLSLWSSYLPAGPWPFLRGGQQLIQPHAPCGAVGQGWAWPCSPGGRCALPAPGVS